MKGIYLTEESKREIEAKIDELEDVKYNSKTDYEWNETLIEQNVYKKILLSATILPVEKSWENVIDMHDPEGACNKYYPNGVIIQPK